MLSCSDHAFPEISRKHQHGSGRIMDNLRLNAYNSDGNALELSTPWSPPSDSQIGVDELDELSDSEPELPLLRLHEWDNKHYYDRTNPECIHYDLRWKISQRERIRARQVSEGSKLDVVLAPSDYWRVTLQSVVDAILSDQEKFPGEFVHAEIYREIFMRMADGYRKEGIIQSRQKAMLKLGCLELKTLS